MSRVYWPIATKHGMRVPLCVLFHHSKAGDPTSQSSPFTGEKLFSGSKSHNTLACWVSWVERSIATKLHTKLLLSMGLRKILTKS